MIAGKCVKICPQYVIHLKIPCLLIIAGAWLFYLKTVIKTREVFSYIQIPLKPVFHTQTAMARDQPCGLPCIAIAIAIAIPASVRQDNSTTEPVYEAQISAACGDRRVKPRKAESRCRKADDP